MTHHVRMSEYEGPAKWPQKRSMCPHELLLRRWGKYGPKWQKNKAYTYCECSLIATQKHTDISTHVIKTCFPFTVSVYIGNLLRSTRPYLVCAEFIPGSWTRWNNWMLLISFSAANEKDIFKRIFSVDYAPLFVYVWILNGTVILQIHSRGLVFVNMHIIIWDADIFSNRITLFKFIWVKIKIRYRGRRYIC